MDGYVITSIDSINSIVYADMTFQGKILHDRVEVVDVIDPVGIATVLQAAYINFQQTITQNQPPVVPPDITALIGQPVDAGTFDATVKQIETPVQAQVVQ